MKQTLIVFLVVLVIAFISIIAISMILPQVPSDITDIAPKNPTVIKDRNGEDLAVMAERKYVPLSQIDEKMQLIAVLVEDEGFWEHGGFDRIGFGRAILKTLMGNTQGASSITQQLARGLFLTRIQTVWRKAAELLISFQIERMFPKEKIMEAYLNTLPLGKGINGIANGTEFYFGVSCDSLSWAQAASLFRTIKSPSTRNAYNNEELFKKGGVWVLKKALNKGIIDQQTYDEAVAEIEAMDFTERKQISSSRDWAVQAVKTDLLKAGYSQEAIERGGLVINSTIDAQMQEAAVKWAAEGMKEIDKKLGLKPYEQASWSEKLDYPQVSIVTVDNETGAIVAYVGSRDYQRSQYDGVTRVKRQVGSSLKPFTYLAAIEEGFITPKTMINDHEVTYHIEGSSDWTPQNYDEKWEGNGQAAYWLSRSQNGPAAQVMDIVKPKAVKKLLQKIGVESEIAENYSLCLGAEELTIIDLAQAYSTLGALGVRHEAHLVSSAIAGNETIIEHKNVGVRVMTPQLAFVGVHLLRNTVETNWGTARRMNPENGWAKVGRRVVGKTGTTNDFIDAIFAGTSPRYTTIVRVGYSKGNVSMVNGAAKVTGSDALYVWAPYMKEVLANTPVESDWQQPANIVWEEYNPHTGEVAKDGDLSVDKMWVAMTPEMKNRQNDVLIAE